jgi:exodeoxyribonuclease VII small subunit
VTKVSEDMNYSKAVERLEEIVQSLERGGIPLDETLKLYEEGAMLLEFCQQELASAEGKLNEMRLTDIETKLAE